MTDSIEENYPGLLEGEVNENDLKEGNILYTTERNQQQHRARKANIKDIKCFTKQIAIF